MRETRRHGGRLLARSEHTWPGLRLELSRWSADPEGDGLSFSDKHLLFVTFAGATKRTEAEIEGAPRYVGSDFAGAVTFIPAHRQRRSWHQGGEIDYAAIWLDPALAGGTAFRGFTNRPDPLIHQLCLALRTEAGSPGEDADLFVHSVATTLGLHLARHHGGPAAPEEPRALEGARLKQVLDRIQDHLGEPLRVDDLAATAGMRRHLFGQAFKQATGLTPHRYVLTQRLRRAAELLTGSGLPIAEIAHRVGLSSQSHLTTLFRARFGQTPHAYRKAKL
ncbi:AraC family transcriptional regulator [Allokutzneria sp. A3M-2-11 16]|uniref:helix-turn-helix domain-containing protein n=1 Tax=Allokutzneria sp. A3M-2-11 16 TaxID=2962043 RepID=UPI0020B710CA|nr:AraC family transcriptional regulator [Allokutzneria sp. A3M-2-11 16]MCP3802369.1 AraC family transcriptional regulator [Allokutzneria sp. A3M-2-11 16]